MTLCPKTGKEINNFCVFLYMLSLLPFFGFSGLRSIIPENVYSIWQTIAMLVLFILLIYNKEVHINAFVLLFVLYKLEVTLVTAFRLGFNTGAFVVDVVFLLIILLMYTQHREILRAVMILGVSAAVLNLLSLFSKGAGAGADYFIGGKNGFSMLLLPMIFLSLISSREKNDLQNNSAIRISTPNYLFIALCVYTIFFSGSSSGIVVSVFVLIFLLLFLRYDPSKTTIFMTVLVLYLLMLFGTEALLESDWWGDFASALGKDADMTGRTDIWSSAFKQLEGNYFFGLGRGADIEYSVAGRSNWITGEAHNILLQLLVDGGIVALVLFSAAIAALVGTMNTADPLQRYAFLALMALLINGLTESLQNKLMFVIVLALANYYSRFPKPIQRTYNPCMTDAES